MAELVTVDHLVSGWTSVGSRADDVDTIHTDTVASVAEARAGDVPEAVTDDSEE